MRRHGSESAVCTTAHAFEWCPPPQAMVMLATDTASADVKFFFGVRRERTSLEIAAQEPSESTPRELAAFVRARPLASPTACRQLRM